MPPTNPPHRKPATAPEQLDRGTLAVLQDELNRLHGAELLEPQRRTDGTAKLAILPADKRIEDLTPTLEKYLPYPLRRKGTATFFDAKSFIAFINRFQNEATAVFANPDAAAPSFTAVIDYHAGNKHDTADVNWLQHRGIFKPKLSDEWQAWQSYDGEALDQQAFAEFVEDRVQDLTVAHFDGENERLKDLAARLQSKWGEPSDLVSLSRSLAISVKVGVKNAVTLNTGEIKVQFETTHSDGAGQPVSIANLFMIAIPVFYGGPAFRIPVRLRYRVAGPALLWTYQMIRPDLVLDAAFTEIVEKIDEDTAAEVFLGAPEA